MTDIHAILASMTLEEKVGQLFVARRPQDGEAAMKAITDYHVGGFTLYACDYEGKTPEGIRALMASYREAAKLNPFIAVVLNSLSISCTPRILATPLLHPVTKPF